MTKLGDALGKPARLIPVSFAMLNAAATLVGKKDMLQRLGGSLQVDISKACELLGWEPKVKVDDALRNTATHYNR